MPVYEYLCPSNGRTLEVLHPMSQTVRTWGELCTLAKAEAGDTPLDAPVEKRIGMPAIATPAGDSQLKNMGFTKLVRRDQGVYENVTATGGEKRYMRADDPSSLPDIKRKIGD